MKIDLFLVPRQKRVVQTNTALLEMLKLKLRGLKMTFLLQRLRICIQNITSRIHKAKFQKKNLSALTDN